MQSVDILGIDPCDRADRAEHPQLPLLGERRVLPGRLEDPLEPHAESRDPPRVVRPSEREERPADQHDPRAGQRHLRAGRDGDRRPGRSGRAGRLTTTSRRGSASRGIRRRTASCRPRRLRHRLRAAVQQLDHEHPLQPAVLLVHGRVAGVRGGARRASDRLRTTNPDGSVRNEPITITGPNTNIGVQDGLGIVGQHHRVEPARSAPRSSRCASPIRTTKDAFTYNWFVGGQTELGWNMVLEANYVGNVGRNFGRLVDYNTVRGDLVRRHAQSAQPAASAASTSARCSRTASTTAGSSS